MADFFPAGKFQLLDNSGDPVSGGKVYTAQPNTMVGGFTDSANYKAAYTDSTGGTNHTNPIVMDSAGRAEIWLSGQYDVWANNADDSTSYWNIANVGGIPQATDIQDGGQVYAEDAGATDAYAITLSPVPGSLTNGFTVRFKPNTDNDGPATLNVNELGAKNIKFRNSTALPPGLLKASGVSTVVYETTGDCFHFQGGDRPFSGARVTNSANLSIPDNTSAAVTWDTETFDIGGWFNSTANNQRLTVPSGVSNVVCYLGVQAGINQLLTWQGTIYKNDAEIARQQHGGAAGSQSNATFTAAPSTGMVNVAAGDYFTATAGQQSGGANFVNHQASWFAIEAIE